MRPDLNYNFSKELCLTKPESVTDLPIFILRDTREQKPLEFQGLNVKIAVDTLQAGDYSLVGHDLPGDDNSIIFERKQNCLELCNNLGSSWDRFKRELDVLKTYKYKQIVICGPDNFDYLIRKRYTMLNMNFIRKRLAEMHVLYDVTVVFMPDRIQAENHIFRAFLEVLRKTKNEQ